MASISSFIPQLFAAASGWIAGFNGSINASGLLLYVINVMTALSGLGLIAASLVLFSRPRGGYGGGSMWEYTGPLRRRGGMAHVGPNVPVFGTRKNPLPFRRPRHPFPWNITGLNVNGRPTYKTKAWKPTNLAMSILRNGLVPGIVGWARYRRGVKKQAAAKAQLAENKAAEAKVDTDINQSLDSALGGPEG